MSASVRDWPARIVSNGWPFGAAVLLAALSGRARGVLRARPSGRLRLELVKSWARARAGKRQQRKPTTQAHLGTPSQRDVLVRTRAYRRTATDTPSGINPEPEQGEEHTKHQNDRGARHRACRQCGLRRGGRPGRQRREDPEAGPKAYPRMRPASPAAEQKHAKGERSTEQRSKHDDLDRALGRKLRCGACKPRQHSHGDTGAAAEQEPGDQRLEEPREPSAHGPHTISGREPTQSASGLTHLASELTQLASEPAP